jgi:hypothetical protein
MALLTQGFSLIADCAAAKTRSNPHSTAATTLASIRKKVKQNGDFPTILNDGMHLA